MRILRIKYGEKNPWDLGGSKDCSQTWPTFVNFLWTPSLVSKKYAGDGRKTHYWNNPWIQTLPISHWSTLVNIDYFNSISIAFDLITQNGWNLELLKSCFHPCLIEGILSIYIPVALFDDRWIQISTPDRQSTPKSAYQLLRGRSQPDNDHWSGWIAL